LNQSADIHNFRNFGKELLFPDHNDRQFFSSIRNISVTVSVISEDK